MGAFKTNLENPNPDVEMVNVGVKAMKSLKKPCPNLSKKKLPRFLKSPRILMKIGPCWTKQVQTCPILPQPVPNLKPPVGSGCRGGHDLPQVGQQWPRFVWFEPQN